MKKDSNTKKSETIVPAPAHGMIKIIGIGDIGGKLVEALIENQLQVLPLLALNTLDFQKAKSDDSEKELDVDLSSKNTFELNVEQFWDEKTKIVIVIAQIDDSKNNEILTKITSRAKNEDILSIVINIESTTRVEMKEDIKKFINSDLQHTYYDAILTIDVTKVDEVYSDLPNNEQNIKIDEIINQTIINVINNCIIGSGANLEEESVPYFATIQKVISNSGNAYIGYGLATGEDRAYFAVQKALKSPLLVYNEINGAQNISLVLSAGKAAISLDEIGIINDYIQNVTGHCSNISMTIYDDLKLKKAIAVNVLATGF
jgi:cell division protein FtsZ